MTPQEESFDSFYGSTRREAMRWSFALTGDVQSARVAVHEAYLRAWQHWRRVSRLDDPFEWVRLRAWQIAKRRPAGRTRDRIDGVSQRQQAVLAAVTELPVAQRLVLLLVEVVGVDLGSAARELEISRDEAQASRHAAVERLATHLDVSADAVPERLDCLHELVENVPLPRAPIVRRAGIARRRGHGLLAGAAATLVTLASGAFILEAGGGLAEGTHQPPAARPTQSASARLPVAGDLLDGSQIRRLGGSHAWRVGRTDTNTSGDGINSVCQQHRFADPSGYAAIVRSFRADGTPRRSAVQTVEVSRSQELAALAYRTTVGWYAGCRAARLQVLDAYRVWNVGDQAEVLTLRVHGRPLTTLSVAVARTGAVTTSTVTQTAATAAPRVRQVVGSLADAVRKLCVRSVAGRCVTTPTYRAAPPPPTDTEKGILSAADLPPVGRVDNSWVGTRPAAARANPSATTCDRADFRRAGAIRSRTRTYLIPEASLPARFGLTETYGAFRTPKAAARFLSRVRDRVRGCEKRDLSTQVVAGPPLAHASRVDGSQWLLSTAVSEDEKVTFRVGFVRVGRTVAQLTFAPVPGADMSAGSFGSLMGRAGERLRELT